MMDGGGPAASTAGAGRVREATPERPLRIVLYNFVQPDDPPSKQGGGVAVYQRNLVAALTKAGHQVISLSSGDRYTFRHRGARLARDRSGARAVIVNSPAFAPGHANFYNIDSYSRSPGLDEIPSALRERLGEVDVFHFQNVEGLTAGFFRELRRTFPAARLIISAHNYSLVCPQMNLWFREHQTCTDARTYRAGRGCVNCLMTPDRLRYELNTRRMGEILAALGLGSTGVRSRAVQLALRAGLHLRRRVLRLFDSARPLRFETPKTLKLMSEAQAGDYRAYREANIALAETVFDKVLAVSERTRQVLVERGMPATKLAVSYIGTAQHPHFAKSRKQQALEGGLNLAYLGYLRADKGFFFLLECLFALPEPIARDISLTIAAPIGDQGPIDRLRGLAHRFRSITVHNGYSHATLETVLAGVNLGIVPVLWEDNLPQVAIEMVARGIPILTSDRGGAQEIGGAPGFIFEAGSTRAFCERLEAIATGRTPLAEFWARPTRIFSMEAHVEDLMGHYRAAAPQHREEAALGVNVGSV